MAVYPRIHLCVKDRPKASSRCRPLGRPLSAVGVYSAYTLNPEGSIVIAMTTRTANRHHTNALNAITCAFTRAIDEALSACR